MLPLDRHMDPMPPFSDVSDWQVAAQRLCEAQGVVIFNEDEQVIDIEVWHATVDERNELLALAQRHAPNIRMALRASLKLERWTRISSTGRPGPERRINGRRSRRYIGPAPTQWAATRMLDRWLERREREGGSNA
jgi:hypothetical protein